MDLTLAPELDGLRRRIRDFVADEILPLEADPAAYDEHENIEAGRLEALRAKAKAAGLWALQMPEARGGLGLSVAGMAVCYEEMGPLDLRAGGVQLRGARRRQHDPARDVAPPRSRKTAGCSRSSTARPALVDRHDRTGAGRRLRPHLDADHG